jgi:hypothetical protein
MKLEAHTQRRRFTRAFKVEAVRMTKEAGVACEASFHRALHRHGQINRGERAASRPPTRDIGPRRPGLGAAWRRDVTSLPAPLDGSCPISTWSWTCTSAVRRNLCGAP